MREAKRGKSRRVERLQEALARLRANLPQTGSIQAILLQRDSISLIHGLTTQIAGKLRSVEKLTAELEPMLRLETIEADLGDRREEADIARFHEEVAIHERKKEAIETLFRREAARIESDVTTLLKTRCSDLHANIGETLATLDKTIPRLDRETTKQRAEALQQQKAVNAECESWVQSEALEMVETAMEALRREAGARLQLIKDIFEREEELLRREYEEVRLAYERRRSASEMAQSYLVLCLHGAEAASRTPDTETRRALCDEGRRTSRAQYETLRAVLTVQGNSESLRLLEECQLAFESELEFLNN